MISAARAQRLRALLEPWAAGQAALERIAYDPVEFPRGYPAPADQEVAGLIAASLSYGRADAFRPKLRWVLERMGPSPAAYLQRFDPAAEAGRFADFVYRFHRGEDLLVLFAGIAEALRRHPSLGHFFAAELEAAGGDLRRALSAFTRALLAWGKERVPAARGREQALDHLLPDAAKGGACKRLLLYLRWMVRRDGVDLGTWAGRIEPARLVIPMDTHLMRLSRHLGLTRRKDASWRTAEEVTASLRLVDAADPVRFDFALCHLGMSGVCPAQGRAEHCARCPLRAECPTGKRRLRRRSG